MAAEYVNGSLDKQYVHGSRADGAGDRLQKLWNASEFTLKILITIIFISLMPLSIFASSLLILEAKDVQSFKIIPSESSGDKILKISGLAFHSSLAVNEITTTHKGDSLNIYVHLAPAKKGLSGDFSHELSIPETINIVRFGKNKTVIWKRGVGPIGFIRK